MLGMNQYSFQWLSLKWLIVLKAVFYLHNSWFWVELVFPVYLTPADTGWKFLLCFCCQHNPVWLSWAGRTLNHSPISQWSVDAEDPALSVAFIPLWVFPSFLGICTYTGNKEERSSTQKLSANCKIPEKKRVDFFCLSVLCLVCSSRVWSNEP